MLSNESKNEMGNESKNEMGSIEIQPASNVSNVSKNEMGNESKESNESNEVQSGFMGKFSIVTGLFCGSCSFPAKIVDNFLGLMCGGQFVFAAISWFVIDKITSIGYIMGGIFSLSTLIFVRKNRLQASVQESVNTLKEENDELKENNEELKENIDDLESVQNKLNEDLTLLKETIGLFDGNAEKVIENLREIYTSLKKENELHSKLNKNMIYIHILQIIRHYDSRGHNISYSLKLEDLEKAKKTLQNAFPNLNYDLLLNKIKENDTITKVTAKNIYDSIKLQH